MRNSLFTILSNELESPKMLVSLPYYRMRAREPENFDSTMHKFNETANKLKAQSCA